ncbi:unnamed protein product [Sphagnum balticum]
MYFIQRPEYIARPECITSASVHGLNWWAETEYSRINVRSTDAIYLHMRRHGHGGARGYKRRHSVGPVPLTRELSARVVNAINQRWTLTYTQTACTECVRTWPPHPALHERRRIYLAAELCIRGLSVRRQGNKPCGAFAYDCGAVIRNASTSDIWADLPMSTVHDQQEWMLMA